MGAADVVVVVAAAIGSLGAVVALAAAFVLVSQVRRLERGVEALRHEALLLVEEAHAAAGHAAAEIARVDAVLADTESVTAAVDQAARAARRAFANPVVKVLAWRAGAVGGLRRLQGRRSDTHRTRPEGAGDGGRGGRDERTSRVASRLASCSASQVEAQGSSPSASRRTFGGPRR